MRALYRYRFFAGAVTDTDIGPAIKEVALLLSVTGSVLKCVLSCEIFL